jgi:hypothetical protein
LIPIETPANSDGETLPFIWLQAALRNPFVTIRAAFELLLKFFSTIGFDLETPAAFGKTRQISKSFPRSAKKKFNYF